MNDRELLELAAKAAGINVIRSRLEDPMRNDLLVRQSGRNPFQAVGSWNPLSDDGDALRLAVKLGLVVNPGCAHDEKNDLDDPYAATRRAVVRAASEIGRQMQEGKEV